MENTLQRTSMDIVAEAIKKQYPSMSEQNKRVATREMLFAPENRMIEIDDKRKMSAKDLRFMTAKVLETPNGESLNVRQAESVESINSGIDPVAEYFSWLNETTSILNHLNDGFISREDAQERENFLELTDQREADLMVCLGLYESCNTKEAEERIRFIRYKLQKLREMRTSIKFLTRTGQDVETTRSEYDYAIPYYQYFKKLKNLPFGYDISAEQKKNLGIRFDDEETDEDHDYYADILNNALDQMKANEQMAAYRKGQIENTSQNSEENENFAGR